MRGGKKLMIARPTTPPTRPRTLWFIFLFCLLQPSCFVSASGDIRHLYDITSADKTDLSLPSDVAVAKDGTICIVDSGNDRVVIFDKKGHFKKAIGSTGSADGLFNAPLGIAVDARGMIYVADKGNHRLQVFKPNGKLVQAIPTMLEGEKIVPVDVAVSGKDGTLFVTGNNNHRIISYTPDGTAIRSWGGQGSNPGEFRYPATLIMTNENLIGAVDVLNSRAQIFSNEGKLIATIGAWGVLPGQLFRPKGIAMDLNKQFYISDSYLEVIQVFNIETHFLYVLGGTDNPHRFESPAGIAIDAKNRLYVAEMLANKISVFELD